MATEAQRRASEKYDRDNTIQVKMKLNKKKDADIINKLNTVSSKQGYIKSLIRKDLYKEKPLN